MFVVLNKGESVCHYGSGALAGNATRSTRRVDGGSNPDMDRCSTSSCSTEVLPATPDYSSIPGNILLIVYVLMDIIIKYFCMFKIYLPCFLICGRYLVCSTGHLNLAPFGSSAEYSAFSLEGLWFSKGSIQFPSQNKQKRINQASF